MKFVKIAPPGTWCHVEAVREMIKKTGGNYFLEVGCGAGDLSLELLKLGYSGVGLDFSDAAIAEASQQLGDYIHRGQYQLIQGDIMEGVTFPQPFDFAISMMVMEHVEDDVLFVEAIRKAVRPGGYVILGVPGRRDRWGIEDETVGHLRRYEREDLFKTLKAAHLSNISVYSVAVPVANLLFHIGNWLVVRSGELDKKNLSMKEQTASSGVREIPFKTVFPSIFRLILNRVTLYPLFLVQRLFYRTGLGLTMLACGQV